MKLNVNIYKSLVYIAVVSAMAIALSACNAQKKNTAAARKYTAFITKYNIYYNGDKHFKETLDNMETKYEDDYSRMLFMHPVEAKADKKLPQPAGDFKRSMEKAQKAIQVRSIKKKPEKKSGKGNDPKYKEWMKREEYNPVMQNSWMLLAKSQYYNGDFLGAASTFFYVSKHFSWLPATVTEAKLWQARSYLALDWLYEAEIIISRIKPDELVNKELKYQYDFTYADFYIRSKEYAKAIPYLNSAIDNSSGAQATRLRFLLGQLYLQIDDKENAYTQFKKVGSTNSASYRTKFNARIKQSEVYTGTNIEPEVKALKSMVKFDRNKDYLDQIYYAIGNLYLTRGDTLHAIENYEQAAAKSTRNGIDKAVAQITLGELYYNKGNYEKAQPCYSEAVPVLPETYKNYKTLKRRSDVLDELAVYSQNVNLQDSLLRLSSMSEEDLMKVIDKIIADLIKAEKEAEEQARREEFQAQQAANGPGTQDKNQREFTINNDNSWYFYNTTSKNAGKTEFQKRWGSRKLEDDWRRRNKSVFNTADFDSDNDEEKDEDTAENSSGNSSNSSSPNDKKEEAVKDENDPHKRAYYLKQIPVTEADKATSHEVIQEGLFNMGVILKDKLDDNQAALAEFNRLLKDYPDNIYRLDVYYNLYLMFMRAGDTTEAEKYRQLILNDFADSQYAVALSDPNYIDNLKKMDIVGNQLYEETYQNYVDNNNSFVHGAYQTMKNDYPLSKLMPKFMFLDALAYVTEKNPEEFKNVLREMLEKYPSTELAPVASAWLKGLAQGRQINSSADGKNLRGRLWDIHLSDDSTKIANDSIAPFEINDEAPQMLVMVFATDEVSPNLLLYEVARHNFNSFVVKDFDLELMNFGRLGMLLIKGFDNMKELNHYRQVMAQSPDFRIPAGVEPVAISVANFNTMLNQGRSFDDYFRYLDAQNYVDPQAKLLKPEEVETLQEAEEIEELIKEESTAEPEVPESSTESSEQKGKADKSGKDKSGKKQDTKQATKPGAKPATTPAKPKPLDVPTGSEGDDDPLLKP